MTHADHFDFENLKNHSTLPRLFREMKKLFRIAEIILMLAFLTWASTRLPFVVRISGEYLRLLVKFVVSPSFIFLLGNIIVLTLFFKSHAHLILFPRRHHELNSANIDLNSSEETFDFCREFITDHCARFSSIGESITHPAPEEIVYQDKQTILEEVTKQPVVKVHRRSQSENMTKSNTLAETTAVAGHNCSNCGKKQLRRSETEGRRRVADGCRQGYDEKAEMVDEMSNEEFQRAIEAFIEKQIKFHQEEKLAIVVRSHN